MATSPRTPRELETREFEARPQSWAPASILPEPIPHPGYTYRWVRLSTRNAADPTNLSSAIREGWTPITVSDHPEMAMHEAGKDSRHAGCVEVGGLLLCRIPKEMAEQRSKYYADLARGQQDALDQSFLREQHASMPMFKSRKTEITFGSGKN